MAEVSIPEPVVTRPPLVPVRFLQKARPYNSGEVAGFKPDIAADLIKRGVAEPFTAPAKEAPAAPAGSVRTPKRGGE